MNVMQFAASLLVCLLPGGGDDVSSVARLEKLEGIQVYARDLGNLHLERLRAEFKIANGRYPHFYEVSRIAAAELSMDAEDARYIVALFRDIDADSPTMLQRVLVSAVYGDFAHPEIVDGAIRLLTRNDIRASFDDVEQWQTVYTSMEILARASTVKSLRALYRCAEAAIDQHAALPFLQPHPGSDPMNRSASQLLFGAVVQLVAHFVPYVAAVDLLSRLEARSNDDEEFLRLVGLQQEAVSRMMQDDPNPYRIATVR